MLSKIRQAPKGSRSGPVPKAVVTAVRRSETGDLDFSRGGGAHLFHCRPFLASLLAVSALIGVPSFVFVQWVAPFVSEFPEKVSAFYWARTIDRAPMALMNMVSSNINQWTLLCAMLAIVFSVSKGAPSAIPFDSQQELELLMTIGQSLVGMIFLINMEMMWWEACALFSLWFVQFLASPIHPGPELWRMLASHTHEGVTAIYFLWFGIEVVRAISGRRSPVAFVLFGKMWRTYVRPPRTS